MSDFNADVRDYMSDIENAGVRYGKSYTDFNKTLNYFNLSRLPDYDNAAEPYIAYILMSRPSLNIGTPKWYDGAYMDTTAQKNLSAFQNNAMSAAFANDAYGMEMLRQLSRFAYNAWMPIITTKAMSYSVGDMNLKTVEKGNTYYGHMIKYGKHSEDHKVSGSISIDFRNDRYLSIMKMIHLWMCYIYNISKNDLLVPYEADQINGILDYAGSIYYLVTRRDGRELVYWEKLVGVFPTSLPFSIFSYNDNMIIQDTVSIEFSYGIRCDPCDPSILMDINFLSGDSYETITSKTKNGYRNSVLKNGSQYLSNERFLNNKETPMVLGDVYARNPYISVQKDSNGNLKYYLLWEG